MRKFLTNGIVLTNYNADVPRLKHICENYIVQELDFDNVVDLLEVAEANQAMQLRGACMRFMAGIVALFFALRTLENYGTIPVQLPENVLQEVVQLRKYLESSHIRLLNQFPTLTTPLSVDREIRELNMERI